MPEEKYELDREYTVPLSRAWIAPRHRRMVRAVNVLREFAERHMKSQEIKIDTKLNEKLWDRGMTRPPRKVTVRMTKDDDGLVTISLPKKPVEEEAEAPKEMLPEPKALPPSEPPATPTAEEASKGEEVPKGVPVAPSQPSSKKEEGERKPEPKKGKGAKKKGTTSSEKKSSSKKKSTSKKSKKSSKK